MILMERETVGEGIHRSGWPRVMQSLRPLATGSGILLDDFADATFSYRSYPNPHKQPWVGIFHHPVAIKSPLRQDALLKLRRMANCKNWLLSLPYLKGVITLCDEAAQALQRWLQLPTLALMHPTESNAPSWNASVAMRKRQLVLNQACPLW